MSKKKGDHPAHGGAWKVAYADFVTAMMALFIVLWILGAGAETQAAVASYFNHPRIFKSGGSGFLSKEGMAEFEGAVKRIRAEEERKEGVDAPDAAPKSSQPEGDGVQGAQGTGEEEGRGGSGGELDVILDRAESLRRLSQQVSIGYVPEGLMIQMAEVEDLPLFESGSAALTDSAASILAAVARLLAPMPNHILIEGHTDALSPSGEGGYSNWELSSERANAARRVLEVGGVDPRRIVSVVGYADRRLLVPGDPTSPRNRRVSIIIVDEDKSP
jgi:chemotaxis protein MotB